ncbi:uncharacterized protein I303_100024 [Kwoniella dejecticola CBS 10117]|uniref:Uncharacterized protein n=1 Tax=Kwoniella dejecticola CBS 10117 TaxID=1296121 RepID=A0A1A6ADV0_9TREE|nr:uncharacterized protein I303_00024 [Kwoniella dejecticola CBS 10117]OBR88213.1 hypothetical protein I303_00024 [Kwoniella dejecticola CBS 10117]
MNTYYPYSQPQSQARPAAFHRFHPNAPYQAQSSIGFFSSPSSTGSQWPSQQFQSGYSSANTFFPSYQTFSNPFNSAYPSSAPYSGVFGNPFQPSLLFPQSAPSQFFPWTDPTRNQFQHSYTTMPMSIGIDAGSKNAQAKVDLPPCHPWTANSYANSMLEFIDAHIDRTQRQAYSAAEHSVSQYKKAENIYRDIMSAAGTGQCTKSDLNTKVSALSSAFTGFWTARSAEQTLSQRRNELVQERNKVNISQISLGTAKSILKSCGTISRKDANKQASTSPLERLTKHAMKNQHFKNKHVLRSVGGRGQSYPSSWSNDGTTSTWSNLPTMPPNNSNTVSSGIPSDIFSGMRTGFTPGPGVGPSINPWSSPASSYPAPYQSNNSYIPPGSNWGF